MGVSYALTRNKCKMSVSTSPSQAASNNNLLHRWNRKSLSILIDPLVNQALLAISWAPEPSLPFCVVRRVKPKIEREHCERLPPTLKTMPVRMVRAYRRDSNQHILWPHFFVLHVHSFFQSDRRYCQVFQAQTGAWSQSPQTSTYCLHHVCYGELRVHQSE